MREEHANREEEKRCACVQENGREKGRRSPSYSHVLHRSDDGSRQGATVDGQHMREREMRGLASQ